MRYGYMAEHSTEKLEKYANLMLISPFPKVI